MKVELFTLRFGGGKSFYARTGEGPPIAIVDAFEVLKSGPLPVIVGMCSVAVKMRFDRTEEGTKQIRISFLGKDGGKALPDLETAIEVTIPGHAADITVPVAFFLKLLCVPAFGDYSVELTVDGRLEAATPLYVRQKA